MTDHPSFNRRDMLKMLAAGSVVTMMPGVSLANLPGDKRLVLFFLRGGMDGLAAVPPYGDPAYTLARGSMALQVPGAGSPIMDLNGFFGMHHGLKDLYPFYANKEMAIIHAISSPYRSRSHFDAQDLIENGSTRPQGARDGWMNRALRYLTLPPERALAVGQQVPLLMQGDVPVPSWMPKSTKKPRRAREMRFSERTRSLYMHDNALRTAYIEGMKVRYKAESVVAESDLSIGRVGLASQKVAAAARIVGEMMAAPEGPRIAMFETGGWDTHSGQGTMEGYLYDNFMMLGAAVKNFHSGIGRGWQDTLMLVFSEFGRMVHSNGSGTDHGTGGVCFLLGGAVRGGRIYGDWAGLDAHKLFEGRDVTPTSDLRSVFKTALFSHLGMDASVISSVVFPDSARAEIWSGLLRT